jgi:ferredoxin
MTPVRLVVDPIACDAFGHCAELLPELITLDEWGYPIIAPGDVPPGLLALAKAAVRACPRRALLLRSAVASPTRLAPASAGH